MTRRELLTLLGHHRGPSPTRPADMDTAFRILGVVCNAMGFTLRQLDSKDRHWRVSWARQMAIALVREHTNWGFRRIGYFFGRQPSACYRACQAVSDQVTLQPNSIRAKQYNLILSSL